MNEYKGYKWKTNVELAIQLGVASCTINHWLKSHPNKTIYDYIERRDSREIAKSYFPDTRIRNTKGEYKNVEWINHSDLAKQLGVTRQFICKLSKQGTLEKYLRKLENTREH